MRLADGLEAAPDAHMPPSRGAISCAFGQSRLAKWSCWRVGAPLWARWALGLDITPPFPAAGTREVNDRAAALVPSSDEAR